MDFGLAAYYVGHIVAIVLCFELGPVFYGPMLANLAFNVSLSAGAFAGWDIRWLVALYGFGIFVWTLVLAGSVNNLTVVLLVFFDVGTVAYRIFPSLEPDGVGQEFWNTMGTAIIDVWMMSVFVLVSSSVMRSSLGARIRGTPVDLLTNPKRRFMIPLGAWAGLIVIPTLIPVHLPEAILARRFDVAAQVLVWGWVAVELPFVIMYRRIRRRFD